MSEREPRGGATRTNPAAAKHLPPGRLLARRFRLGEILGVGGMGVVYEAEDEDLGLPVAVKLLRPEMADDPSLQERFRREIILARQVSHRNVVRIHDLFQDGDLRFLTMDLVRGRSLRDVLSSDGAMPADRAVDLARQLARALEAAHEQGVVHRDLKPENVLVEGDGEDAVARISDFGIARSLGGASAAGLTATGTVVGSLQYLSPEQARGGELDGRSDLYSLGLILHEMLSGELPFRRGTDAEMLAQRIGSSPSLDKLAGVPAWLRRVVGRLLQRDPERRYPDAASLLRDLEAESFGTRGEARPASRLRIGLAAAVIVGLAVAVVALWQARDGRPPAPDHSASELGPRNPQGPRHALAVLPLVDRTGRADLAWTARGSAEMLAQALAESRDLRVVDSLRVFRLLEDLGMERGARSDGLARRQLAEIADLLDVDRVVVGTLRAEGEGLRLELRLLEPAPDGTASNLAADVVPGDLGATVAKLADDLRGALEAAAAVRSPEALEDQATDAARASYDRGVEKLLQGDSVAATGFLEQAVDRSPAFMAAWIRLSDAYERQGRLEDATDAIRQASRLAGAAEGRRVLEIAAREAELRGDPEQAQQLWLRLVDLYPQDVEARVRLAACHGEAGSLDEARRLLLEVVAVDRKHPRAWYLLSKYTIQAGDLHQAVDEYLVHALVIQNQLDNDPGRADVLNAMGVAYDRLGRLDLAAQRYGEAAELRRKIGDLRGYAASLRNLGAVAAVRGDYSAAQVHYDKAAGVLEELGDRHGLASLTSRLGLLEEEKGDYRRALELFRKALRMRRDLGDSRALVESYNHVGYAYYLLGDYDNAGVYWRQALDELAAEGNRQSEVFVRQSLGLLQLAQGQWDEAARSFLEALEVSRELDMPDTRAVSLGYLGRLAQLQGRYAAALESYGQALEILDELEDPRGLAEFGLLRAEALLELGDAGAARKALDAVSEALGQAGNREQTSRLRVIEMRIALARGELDRAADLVEEATAEAVASQSVVASWESRWARARLCFAGGRLDQAAVELEDLRAEAESLGNAMFHLLAAESQGEVALARGRAEAARRAFEDGLAVLAPDMAYAGRFRLHLGLARALEALGDEAGAAAETERARDELQRLRSEIEAPYLATFEHRPEVQALAG